MVRKADGTINWVAVATLILPTIGSIAVLMLSLWVNNQSLILAEKTRLQAKEIILEEMSHHERRGPHDDVDRRITVLETQFSFITRSLERIEKRLNIEAE